MSSVSLPALHLRGSYLNSTLFCEGGKLLLSEKLVKLPALASPPTSLQLTEPWRPDLSLVSLAIPSMFLEMFLGDRRLGRAPRFCGRGRGEVGGEDGELVSMEEARVQNPGKYLVLKKIDRLVSYIILPESSSPSSTSCCSCSSSSRSSKLMLVSWLGAVAGQPGRSGVEEYLGWPRRKYGRGVTSSEVL